MQAKLATLSLTRILLGDNRGWPKLKIDTAAEIVSKLQAFIVVDKEFRNASVFHTPSVTRFD